MKFSKKRSQYESSNVSFNPETMVATSYDWWEFVKVINGYVVFNNYNYSPTTGKHQYKVRDLLEKLGIKVDLVVSTSYGLDGNSRGRTPTDTIGALSDAIKNVENEIKELEEILANPRRKKALDMERQNDIIAKEALIKEIERVKLGNKLKAVLK